MRCGGKVSGRYIGEGQIRVNALGIRTEPVPTIFNPNVITVPYTKFINVTIDG